MIEERTYYTMNCDCCSRRLHLYDRNPQTVAGWLTLAGLTPLSDAELSELDLSPCICSSCVEDPKCRELWWRRWPDLLEAWDMVVG